MRRWLGLMLIVAGIAAIYMHIPRPSLGRYYDDDIYDEIASGPADDDIPSMIGQF